MTEVIEVVISVDELTMPTVVTVGGVDTLVPETIEITVDPDVGAVPELVEVFTGMPGPTGPVGPPSTPTVSGIYEWVEPLAGRGDVTLESGKVTGDEIADGGSQLQITQVDLQNRSYEWMQMQPGDRVIIRDYDEEESGYHQLVVTGRYAEGAQVFVDYTTMASSGTSVIGKTVEVIALGPELVEEGTLVPGPAGPTGPEGPPGILRVNHGSDPSVARPDASIVLWVGSVTPTFRDETVDLIAWTPYT